MIRMQESTTVVVVASGDCNVVFDRQGGLREKLTKAVIVLMFSVSVCDQP